MPSTPLTTFNDLLEHARDYLGGNPTPDANRDCRRAVLAAMRELAGAHRWSYYYQRGRIATVASYTTGTITYTHTGGAYERLVTLASGTWPDWAAFGQLVIANVIYQVATRESTTQITLSVNSNPGANVAAGTSYTLYRDTYPLPLDFIAADRIVNGSNAIPLEFVLPGDWLYAHRTVPPSPSTPRWYTVFGSGDHQGSLGLSLYPPPDSAYNLEFVYQRRPRPLVIDGLGTDQSQGTASSTSGSRTLTGSGTAFASKHVGCVIRLSPNGTEQPTGIDGANPYAEERIVTAVASATSLTLDAVASATYSGVKYLLSDPVDIEEGTMKTALLRNLERLMAIARIMKNARQAEQAYEIALIRAREMDSRNFGPTSYGRRAGYVSLRDMPSGSQIE